MNFEKDDVGVTVLLEGRVDTSNADSFEQELTNLRNENSGGALILDAEKLDYISSAGLRVILRTLKKNPTLKITNASSEIYEIFEMTGFSEMLTIEKAYKSYSVDGCDIIGKGAKGTVYRYNADTIIKVYNSAESLPDIQRERELARKAFVLGIPTAISYDVCKVDGKFGSVFELLDAKSFSQIIAEDSSKIPLYAKKFGELLHTIHTTPVKKEDMPDTRNQSRKWILTAKEYLPEEDIQILSDLIENAPDDAMMIHGDYHTNNVMEQNGESILIDMDTLSHGNGIFELAVVYFTYVGYSKFVPENPEKFLGISKEAAAKFWDEFIVSYLTSTDEKKVSEITKQVRVLSLLRSIRMLYKRDHESAEGIDLIRKAADELHELLPGVKELRIEE